MSLGDSIRHGVVILFARISPHDYNAWGRLCRYVYEQLNPELFYTEQEQVIGCPHPTVRTASGQKPPPPEGALQGALPCFIGFPFGRWDLICVLPASEPTDLMPERYVKESKNRIYLPAAVLKSDLESSGPFIFKKSPLLYLQRGSCLNNIDSGEDSDKCGVEIKCTIGECMPNYFVLLLARTEGAYLLRNRSKGIYKLAGDIAHIIEGYPAKISYDILLTYGWPELAVFMASDCMIQLARLACKIGEYMCEIEKHSGTKEKRPIFTRTVTILGTTTPLGPDKVCPAHFGDLKASVEMRAVMGNSPVIAEELRKIAQTETGSNVSALRAFGEVDITTAAMPLYQAMKISRKITGGSSDVAKHIYEIRTQPRMPLLPVANRVYYDRYPADEFHPHTLWHNWCSKVLGLDLEEVERWKDEEGVQPPWRKKIEQNIGVDAGHVLQQMCAEFARGAVNNQLYLDYLPLAHVVFHAVITASEFIRPTEDGPTVRPVGYLTEMKSLYQGFEIYRQQIENATGYYLHADIEGPPGAGPATQRLGVAAWGACQFSAQMMGFPYAPAIVSPATGAPNFTVEVTRFGAYIQQPREAQFDPCCFWMLAHEIGHCLSQAFWVKITGANVHTIELDDSIQLAKLLEKIGVWMHLCTRASPVPYEVKQFALNGLKGLMQLPYGKSIPGNRLLQAWMKCPKLALAAKAALEIASLRPEQVHAQSMVGKQRDEDADAKEAIANILHPPAFDTDKASIQRPKTSSRDKPPDPQKTIPGWLEKVFKEALGSCGVELAHALSDWLLGQLRLNTSVETFSKTLWGVSAPDASLHEWLQQEIENIRNRIKQDDSFGEFEKIEDSIQYAELEDLVQCLEDVWADLVMYQASFRSRHLLQYCRFPPKRDERLAAAICIASLWGRQLLASAKPEEVNLTLRQVYGVCMAHWMLSQLAEITQPEERAKKCLRLMEFAQKPEEQVTEWVRKRVAELLETVSAALRCSSVSGKGTFLGYEVFALRVAHLLLSSLLTTLSALSFKRKAEAFPPLTNVSIAAIAALWTRWVMEADGSFRDTTQPNAQQKRQWLTNAARWMLQSVNAWLVRWPFAFVMRQGDTKNQLRAREWMRKCHIADLDDTVFGEWLARLKPWLRRPWDEEELGKLTGIAVPDWDLSSCPTERETGAQGGGSGRQNAGKKVLRELPPHAPAELIEGWWDVALAHIANFSL